MSVWRKINKIFAIGLLLSVGFGAGASACTTGLQTCSTTYGVGEVFFGAGGSLNSCSTSYCTKQSLGETGVGNPKSTNYQAEAGFNTNRDPYLEFSVTSSNVNFGILTAGKASTGTAAFYVKTYLANGYVVQNATATTPTYGTHTIPGISSTSAYNSSVEEFGMNLVANSGCTGSPGNGLPASFGANPVQVPSSAFSFGAAATGYNTACQFRYVNGETVAQSSQSSGETDFTISYIINSLGSTPAGVYTMNHILVATSTF